MTTTILKDMTLYGDLVSGNCHKTKWTADYLGLPYTWVPVDVVEGEARTDAFLNICPTGKVPFLKLANGRGLPESNAIILFLADTVGGGGLIPDDAFTRAQMMSWLFWEQYSHEPAIAVRRYQKRFLEKSDDEIPAALMEKGITALSLLEKQLSHTEYLVGDSITLADIALVAYTRLAPEGGFDLSRYPGIMAWIKRAEGDLRF